MILFFDIETHRVLEWDQLTDEQVYAFENHLWDRKIFDSPSDQFKEISALHPEFSRVISVSMGYEKGSEFVMQSYSGINELDILTQLKTIFDNSKITLCGHNIKGFDIPYLAKRYIINGMKIPVSLNMYGKKPWEITHLDTMEMWKFGGWQNVSLQVIASSLGIECKATEYKGNTLYLLDIEEVDFEKLNKYCESDVYATYKIYKRITESL